jgi:lipopolysaccharide assembly outer membrane protein LptD (OstA)
MTLAEAGGDGRLPSFVATQTDATFTVGLDAEWRINDNWAVFAEGRNLTGSRVYEWLHYYRDTAECLVGLKFNF